MTKKPVRALRNTLSLALGTMSPYRHSITMGYISKSIVVVLSDANDPYWDTYTRL